MSNFVEILGENKASFNKDLRVRLTLEDPKRSVLETNLFYDVNQEAQYYKEKAACEFYRIYGSVAPSFNLKLREGEKPNYNLFRFIPENWQIALLKATKFNDAPGKQRFLKQNIHEYDFSYGLPCLKMTPIVEEFKNYMAFNMYLGHNIQQDDRVYITSLDPEYLKSGYYNVIGVDGQVVYIDQEYEEVIPDWSESEFTTEVTIDQQAAAIEAEEIENKTVKPQLVAPPISFDQEFVETVTTTTTKKKLLFFKKKKTVTTEVRSKYVSAVSMTNAAPDSKSAADNHEIFRIKNTEVGLLTPSVLAEMKKKRPNISKLIKPTFFIKKVQEDYHLEYYMKQAEVVALVSEFNDCAFALSATGEQMINFTFSDLNVSGMTDNHGVPVTELFLAIIKRPGNDDKDISDTEANFAKLVDYTELGEGLETVLEKQTGKEVDSLKVGDKLFVGLYEYDKEELLETKISDLQHRVMHRDVAFAYKPFYPIQLRAFSSYVEDSETKAYMPDYAVYSDIRQKYIWRDILDVGFFEQEGIGIDHAFMNGAFYIYNHLVFTLRNDFSVKYRYNVNDINKLDSLNLEMDDVRDILQDLLVEDEVKNNKGFEEFKTKKC